MSLHVTNVGKFPLLLIAIFPAPTLHYLQSRDVTISDRHRNPAETQSGSQITSHPPRIWSSEYSDCFRMHRLSVHRALRFSSWVYPCLRLICSGLLHLRLAVRDSYASTFWSYQGISGCIYPQRIHMRCSFYTIVCHLRLASPYPSLPPRTRTRPELR